MDSPSGVSHDTVKFLVALFAKVVFRTFAFVHDTNTAAMLPDVTCVALDEKTASLVRGWVRG